MSMVVGVAVKNEDEGSKRLKSSLAMSWEVRRRGDAGAFRPKCRAFVNFER